MCGLSPVSVLWRINQEGFSKSLVSLPSLMDSQPRVNCGFQTCWGPEERCFHEEKMATRNHNTTLFPFLLADTGSSTHFRLSDFHTGFRIPSEDSVRFHLKELGDNAHPRLLPRVHMALNIEEPRGNVLPFPSSPKIHVVVLRKKNLPLGKWGRGESEKSEEWEQR